MKRIVLAAAAALSIALPAHATVMVATFTATASDGTDTAGIFGGGDLAGLPALIAFTYDTSLQPNTGGFLNALNFQNYGGGPSPILGIDLTINGYTDHLDGSLLQSNVTSGISSGVEFSFYLLDGSYGDVGMFVIPASLNAPYSFTGQGGGYIVRPGYFADFSSSSLDAVSAPTGGVPEPATWALMILGFGSAGAMLRRRGRLALA